MPAGWTAADFADGKAGDRNRRNDYEDACLRRLAETMQENRPRRRPDANAKKAAGPGIATVSEVEWRDLVATRKW